MPAIEIHVLPEVEDFLYYLSDVLVLDEYKPSYESAEKIVDDIIDFISRLASVPHYKISSSVEYHFAKYGENLQYAFFKRKSSPKTTWYVFFVESENRILVKYITNNWIEGQYIR